jgi:hypothetical protein
MYMKRWLIVAIIILLLIGGAASGWYYWDKHQKPSNSESSSQNQTSNTSDPSEGGKYLVIKEWGVKVSVPEELKGSLFYSLREEDPEYVGMPGADLSSKLFSPECRDAASDLGLTILRTTRQLTPPEPYVYKINVLHSGNYWYHAAFGKDGCSKFLTENKADEFNKLYESVGSIQKIN